MMIRAKGKPEQRKKCLVEISSAHLYPTALSFQPMAQQGHPPLLSSEVRWG